LSIDIVHYNDGWLTRAGRRHLKFFSGIVPVDPRPSGPGWLTAM